MTMFPGHMTISLLSHLLHPHPAATKIVLSEPLASAVLISPWNKLFPSPSSMDTYKQTSDMIIPNAGQRWSSMYLGEHTRLQMPSQSFAQLTQSETQ
jgi:hypothetical protein